ncbi:hypothetical protein [Candidatus Methylacidiphilum infernorum]|uniref:hypothetical protein n=1 Tax=Candidatus Methylacidiphilum infernorum TaxID=511746 RepID=UPI000325FB30|nr:hypothetical protein [Candidatus Methylacidiphilum infernorum]
MTRKKWNGLAKIILQGHLLFFSFLLFFCSCTHTHFYPYQGKNTQTGKGAAKRVIDGIDVWSDGLPKKKYTVIGVIHDNRSGLFSSGVLKSVVKKAKQHGADGVIEYQAYAVAVNNLAASASGFASNADQMPSTFGPTMSSWLAFTGPASAGLAGAQSGQSRWWVIKYLPEEKKSSTVRIPKEEPLKKP